MSYNNTQLSINRQFLDQLYKSILHSHKSLKTKIESCSIPTHEFSFNKLIQIKIQEIFSNTVKNQSSKQALHMKLKY